MTLPEPRTEQEIHVLSIHYLAGRVTEITDVPFDEVPFVFPILAMGGADTIYEQFGDDEDDLIKISVFAVEGVDTMGATGCNGRPMFFSCQVWLAEDVEKAWNQAQDALAVLATKKGDKP